MKQFSIFLGIFKQTKKNPKHLIFEIRNIQSTSRAASSKSQWQKIGKMLFWVLKSFNLRWFGNLHDSILWTIFLNTCYNEICVFSGYNKMCTVLSGWKLIRTRTCCLHALSSSFSYFCIYYQKINRAALKCDISD